MPSAFSAAEINLDELIDLDTFPIHDLTSRARADLVGSAQSEMRSIGCVRIANFIRLETVNTMALEARDLHPMTFWCKEDHNPYFSAVDDEFPYGHPRRTLQHRESGFINSDLLTTQSRLRQLYDSDVLLHFIWECLGVPQPIYRWADPLGRNPYGVMETDHYFPWHFDGNEFTVSVLVQKAERGGVFEYVPDIRETGNENFERVQHILEGGRDSVCELDLVPGDLQLFKGRYSMHRVTHIQGPTTRYVALPSYVHDPWRVNRPHHSINYYGRATELHYAREAAIADGLVD